MSRFIGAQAVAIVLGGNYQLPLGLNINSLAPGGTIWNLVTTWRQQAITMLTYHAYGSIELLDEHVITWSAEDTNPKNEFKIAHLWLPPYLLGANDFN